MYYDIYDIYGVSLAELLAKCPNLTQLTLKVVGEWEDDDTLFGDKMLAIISKNCPKVTVLELANFVEITDDGVARLLQGLAGNAMISLEFSGSRNLTAATLLKIAELFPGLKYLNLSYCGNIGKAALLDLILTRRLCCGDVWHEESEWIKAELDKHGFQPMPKLHKFICAKAPAADDDGDDTDEVDATSDEDAEDDAGDEDDEDDDAVILRELKTNAVMMI